MGTIPNTKNTALARAIKYDATYLVCLHLVRCLQHDYFLLAPLLR